MIPSVGTRITYPGGATTSTGTVVHVADAVALVLVQAGRCDKDADFGVPDGLPDAPLVPGRDGPRQSHHVVGAHERRHLVHRRHGHVAQFTGTALGDRVGRRRGLPVADVDALSLAEQEDHHDGHRGGQ